MSSDRCGPIKRSRLYIYTNINRVLIVRIGNIDPIVTKLLRNVEKANTETSIRVENEGKRLKLIQVADEGVEYSDTELSEEIVESNDPTISFNSEMKNSILGNSHFPRNMRNTIQAADRYGISDRALADILNNFLIDLDMVNETINQ